MYKRQLYLWDEGEVEPSEVPLIGLRAGAGVMLDVGPVWTDIQVAESFAPYPVRTEVDGRVHIQFREPWNLHLGGGKAWRNMSFEVDEAALEYQDESTYVSVGLGIGLR